MLFWPAFIWRFLFGAKKLSGCLLQTKWLMKILNFEIDEKNCVQIFIRHFVFRRQSHQTQLENLFGKETLLFFSIHDHIAFWQKNMLSFCLFSSCFYDSFCKFCNNCRNDILVSLVALSSLISALSSFRSSSLDSRFESPLRDSDSRS